MKRFLIFDFSFLIFFAAIFASLRLCGLCLGGSTVVPELSPSGVPEKASAILAGYYSEAARKFRAMVMQPVPGGPTVKQVRASQLIHQVDQVLLELGKKTNLWVGKELPAAYVDGLRRGNLQAEEMGKRIPEDMLKPSFDQIDRGTVAILARDAAGDLHKAADSMGQQTKKLLRQTAQIGLEEKEINKILAGGVIEGQPRETIIRLRDALKKTEEGRVAIQGKEGIRYFDAEDYARMVVRTKTRQASVTARLDRLSDLNLDLVMIVGRVSKNFCTAYLGLVFSISGKSEKYPPLASIPQCPMHPNCSKSPRAYVDELATDKEKEMAEPNEDQEKLIAIGSDTSRLQRAFKDLQLESQVKARYATTERKLFG